MNIIIFGPPGAGKGTQSDNLVKEFNLFKVSTGELLREEIKKKSLLGNEIKPIVDQGLLVSDNIINGLIDNILSNKIYYNRLIFDGYPRNLNQANQLNFLIKQYNQKLSFAFNLNVDLDIIIKRILGRQVCSKCGLVFNTFYKPPKENNHICDSKHLIKRSDDNEKTIRNRFETYKKETLPVMNYYKKENLLYDIDGKGNIGSIYTKIREIICSLET